MPKQDGRKTTGKRGVTAAKRARTTPIGARRLRELVERVARTAPESPDTPSRNALRSRLLAMAADVAPPSTSTST